MRLNQLTLIFTLLYLTGILSGCSHRTNDAYETFKYWSGSDATEELQLLKGQYYESPHFTKEYIMYLKFKPKRKWWLEYLKYNSIEKDENDWTIPNDAPHWFKPPGNAVRYWRKDDFDQGSRYFCDTTTGICYIYEIQL